MNLIDRTTEAGSDDEQGQGGRANARAPPHSPIASCHRILKEVESARLLAVLHLLKQELKQTGSTG